MDTKEFMNQMRMMIRNSVNERVSRTVRSANCMIILPQCSSAVLFYQSCQSATLPVICTRVILLEDVTVELIKYTLGVLHRRQTVKVYIKLHVKVSLTSILFI